MIKYSFSDGPVTIRASGKADPQKIGEALEKIAAAHAGRLTPEAVVEAAKAPKHPLHNHLTWDDAEAAHAFRLQEAREIIRVIRVEEEDEDSKRAFVSVSDKDGRSYRSLGEIQGNRDLQLLVLKQAERDLDAFQHRYRELTDICSLVKPASEALKGKRKQAETRAAA